MDLWIGAFYIYRFVPENVSSIMGFVTILTNERKENLEYTPSVEFISGFTIAVCGRLKKEKEQTSLFFYFYLVFAGTFLNSN